MHTTVADFKKRRDKRSRLMKAKRRQDNGHIVNLCPCGCNDADLDDNDYCKHLIGFTVPREDGKKATHYEPREPRYREGEIVSWFTNGSNPQPIPAGAILEEITVSSRVYHPQGLPQLKSDKKEK